MTTEWCGFCPACVGATVRRDSEPRVCLVPGPCEGATLIEYDPVLHSTEQQRRDAA